MCRSYPLPPSSACTPARASAARACTFNCHLQNCTWLKALRLDGSPRSAASCVAIGGKHRGRSQCVHMPPCVHSFFTFLLFYVSHYTHGIRVIAHLASRTVGCNFEAVQFFRLLAELARIQQGPKGTEL